MRRRYRYGVIALLSLGLCGIFGCTKTSEDLDNSVVDEATSYDVNDYKERFRADRISVEDYGSQYSEDASVVADMDYKQLHFDDVVFADFPETDQLILGTDREEEISVEDALAITEDWLQEIGKEDEINLETDLALDYLDHPYLEIREDEPMIQTLPDIEWPLYFTHISELKYGTGAFIDRPDCSMDIERYGMQNMSDGKFSAYLNGRGITENARYIFFSDEWGTEVASGKIEELADESFPLLDGEMSVGDGADAAETYFAEDDARMRWDNIGLKLEDVTVYQYDKIYCYEYTARRTCYGIPVVRSGGGVYNFYGTYYVCGDVGRAYVMDHDGVTAYVGINDGQDVIPLLSEKKLIGLADATKILSDGLASEINVDVNFIELAYLPLGFENSDDSSEVMYFPCWHFSGRNRVKDEQIELYVDVLTGDIYYYTWDTDKAEYGLETVDESGRGE